MTTVLNSIAQKVDDFLRIYYRDTFIDSRLFIENNPKFVIVERIEELSNGYPITHRVISLIVWNEKRARVLEVDWPEKKNEGFNPHWFLRILERKPQDAIEVFSNKLQKKCPFQNYRVFLYLTPLTLGTKLQGIETEYTNEVWQKEWCYSNCDTALQDLQNVLNFIKKNRKV